MLTTDPQDPDPQDHMDDQPQPWAEEAACKPHRDLFLRAHDATDVDAVGRAKEVCLNCPVQAECLMYALEEQIEFGVWGGMDPSEREVVRDMAKEARS